MGLGSNIRIMLVVCFFLGANWILIDLLPLEVFHAHTEPTANAAMQRPYTAVKVTALQRHDGASGFYR